MSMALDLPVADVRARGLSIRLFPRSELETLAAEPDLPSLARAMEGSGRLTEGIARPVTPTTLEAATRRTTSALLTRLASWVPRGSPALDLFFADQDRRSLRALLRGAMDGTATDARIAGLLATPRLPERALSDLAHLATPAKVSLHLVVLGHPDAAALVAVTSRTRPVVLDIELVLLRGFAARLVTAARQADRNLRNVASRRIDECNIEIALSLAGRAADLDVATCFVPGGHALGRPAFVEAARLSGAGEAALHLARTMEPGTTARLVGACDGDPARFEHDALVSALAEQHDVARLDPLGSAPLLRFLLRLEAQGRDLRRLAWGSSLGVPSARLQRELVTPWS